MIRIHLDNTGDDPEDTIRLYSLPGVADAAAGLIGHSHKVLKFYLRLDRGFPEIVAKADEPDVTH